MEVSGKSPGPLGENSNQAEETACAKAKMQYDKEMASSSCDLNLEHGPEVQYHGSTYWKTYL